MYVPSTRNIISSYDVVFDESFSSVLVYISQPCSEAMSMRPEVTYTPCATYLREKTGNIITFAQFEVGNISTKKFNDTEIDDDDSIMPTILSKEDMDVIDSGNDSDHDLISTEMLEDISDVSQSHSNVNQRESRYKIRDCISQI